MSKFPLIESSRLLLDTTPVHAISNTLLTIGGEASTVRSAGDNSAGQAGITTQTKARARGVNAELSGRQSNASKQYEQDAGSHGCLWEKNGLK
jgi:hypothetical protein